MDNAKERQSTERKIGNKIQKNLGVALTIKRPERALTVGN